MADSWISIENPSGSGYLIPKDSDSEKIPVEYRLSVSQQMIGDVTRGLIRIDGFVLNPADDLFALRNLARYFTLFLSDGRKLDFFIKDQDGSIANSGPGIYVSPPGPAVSNEP